MHKEMQCARSVTRSLLEVPIEEGFGEGEIIISRANPPHGASAPSERTPQIGRSHSDGRPGEPHEMSGGEKGVGWGFAGIRTPISSTTPLYLEIDVTRRDKNDLRCWKTMPMGRP